MEYVSEEHCSDLEDVIKIEWNDENLVKNVHLWNDGEKDKWHLIRCEGWKSRSGEGWEDENLEMGSLDHEFVSNSEESLILFRRWVNKNFPEYLAEIDG